MSLLMKDMFTFTGAANTYSLEATTPKSRDQYAHFGFEVGRQSNGNGRFHLTGLLGCEKHRSWGWQSQPWGSTPRTRRARLWRNYL
jgi:hypothetical protein